MAVTNFTATATTYTEVSTQDNITQNKSPWPLRVHFGPSAPSADTEDFHLLQTGQSLTRSDGFPAGNTYVRSGFDGLSNEVAVAE